MLKYNTKKTVSKDIILYLRTLDGELTYYLIGLLKKKESFSNLSVKYHIEVLDGEGQTGRFFINSNDTNKLAGSKEVAGALRHFLGDRKQEMLSAIADEVLLVFEFHFTMRDKGMSGRKNNDYGQSKQGDLPYYAPVKPRYTFDQIVLPDNVRQLINEAINIITYQDLIYNVWGFSEVDSVPKSILNFYGPPGTGKTMCAHAIANELGKKLLALNYSEIESKFVGDAPKNLQRAFEIATEEDCVLFFDEADSFLGKRIQNVNQSADQALNSLRSQMLILLEEHKGVIIFATNLVSNFDKAFESRILKHIKFELPNEEARIAIIKKMIPSKLPLAVPLQDSELHELAQITEGFSGREIKNAILDMLLAKATKDKGTAVFYFLDFKDAFEGKKKEMETLKKEKESNKVAKIKKAFAEGRVEPAKKEAKDTNKEKVGGSEGNEDNID